MLYDCIKCTKSVHLLHKSNQDKQMKGMHTVAAAAQQGGNDTQFLFYEATMNTH